MDNFAIQRAWTDAYSPSHLSRFPTILHWHVVTDTLFCAAEKEMDRNETYYPCFFISMFYNCPYLVWGKFKPR